MKYLRTMIHFSAEQLSIDSSVSHMLMGFVERKISPQTIADVLRAQIFESQISIHQLNKATCNGILEAITLASSLEECTDIVLYLSTHPDFPENLSFKAAAGALCVLLRHVQRNQEHDFFHISNLSTELSFLKETKTRDELIEALSSAILNLFHSQPQSVDIEVKDFLIQIIKSSHSVLTQALHNNPRFQHLCFILLTPNADVAHIKGLLPKPYDMIFALLKTPDEQLLQKGVSAYETEPNERNSSGRIQYLQLVIEMMQSNACSETKKIFLIEWLFEKGLIEAILNENTTMEYLASLKYSVDHFGNQNELRDHFTQPSSIIKGMFKAIQKDFSQIMTMSALKDTPSSDVFLRKANKIACSIFPQLVLLAEKDLSYVTKHLAHWALDMVVPNEQFRFFQKQHWRWIRSLSAKIWDASLREPPTWVVDAGSLYCAAIFHSAPALWLQEYSVSLIEKLHQETLAERFILTSDQFNYVEYLIRCIRKKSPFFASRTESLFALALLSRMTRNEAQQYENTKARFQSLLVNYSLSQIQSSPEFLFWKQALDNEESFKQELGNNPVTRALAVLLRLAKETAKKAPRE